MKSSLPESQNVCIHELSCQKRTSAPQNILRRVYGSRQCFSALRPCVHTPGRLPPSTRLFIITAIPDNLSGIKRKMKGRKYSIREALRSFSSSARGPGSPKQPRCLLTPRPPSDNQLLIYDKRNSLLVALLPSHSRYLPLFPR